MMDIEPETVPVLVKWGKERIPVEIDYSESPMVFKAQLMTLTRVPIERQKIIFKGRILDDDEWAGFRVGKNTVMTMVGTDDAIPATFSDSKASNQIPLDKPLELPEKEKVPLGFTNLGNTCYMNASFQLIKCITPIKNFIRNKTIDTTGVADATKLTQFYRNLKDVFRMSDPREESYRLQITVNMLVSSVEVLLPQFQERDKNGLRIQQDVNEFMLKIFGILKEMNFISENEQNELNDTSVQIAPQYGDIVDTYLRIELDQTTTCDDIAGYEPTRTQLFENIFSFVVDAETRDLMRGITKRMTDSIQMFHDESNQEITLKRHSTFTRLPAYFCVHLGRFFFKAKQNICAKVLREVKLPFVLDLFTLCSDELQKTLIPMRNMINTANENAANEVEMAEVSPEDSKADNPEETTRDSAPHTVYSLPEQNLDAGSSGSAIYNLKAIITHKGRYSSSGHYVAWVKIAENVWAKLDDSQVTLVNDEHIKKLYGGGEWHSAYVALYEAETVPPKL